MANVTFSETPGGFGITREWAKAWEALMVAEWEKARPLYRARVEQFWQAEYEQTPDSFSMVGPCEIVIVATLLRYWVLVRPAAVDSLRVLSRWEDEELDCWQSVEDPPQTVRTSLINRLLDGDEAWTEIESGRLYGQAPPSPTPSRFHLVDPGISLADGEASHANVVDVFSALTGQRIDRKALRAAEERLSEISAIPDARARGRALEPVLAAALRAHGCTVEPGKTFDGEQVDLFLSEPQVALIEVRWRKHPQETKAINDLTRKVQRRPPVFCGLYVSMSGFTRGAINAARDARDRAIFLMNEPDTRALFSGETHFTEFWRTQIQQALRRY